MTLAQRFLWLISAFPSRRFSQETHSVAALTTLAAIGVLNGDPDVLDAVRIELSSMDEDEKRRQGPSLIVKAEAYAWLSEVSRSYPIFERLQMLILPILRAIFELPRAHSERQWLLSHSKPDRE